MELFCALSGNPPAVALLYTHLLHMQRQITILSVPDMISITSVDKIFISKLTIKETRGIADTVAAPASADTLARNPSSTCFINSILHTLFMMAIAKPNINETRKIVI